MSKAVSLLAVAATLLLTGCLVRPLAPPPGKPCAAAAQPVPAVPALPATEPAAVGNGAPPAAEAPAPAPPAKPPAPAEPSESAEVQLVKAQTLFEGKRFEDAGSAADKLTGSTSVGARARELAGNAWFAAGDAAQKDERFADAVAAYKRAEPWRKDAAAALAAAEQRRREKAEEFYNAGVRFFINQKLDEAILSWEQTLAVNPDHPNAAKDIAKARGLQQKLKELR